MSIFLTKGLSLFEKYFKQKGLIEICINKPGEIWLENFKGWQHKKDSNLHLQALLDIGQTLATYRGQKFSDETPLLSTSLPEPYNYRIQVLGKAIAEHNIAISIRVAQAVLFPLASYDKQIDPQKIKSTQKTKPFNKKSEELKNAVENQQTLLIVGATGSGKTTFLNSLIHHINRKKRIIIIEDTKELIVPHENCVRIIKSKTTTDIAKITYKDIINACMRLRPDILLLGELDIENTVPFLRILNTGHRGSMSTLHANSPKDAMEAMILNAKLSGMQGDEAIRQYIKNAFDKIVFIERQKDKFNITIEGIK